jgi:hypothetical protein
MSARGTEQTRDVTEGHVTGLAAAKDGTLYITGNRSRCPESMPFVAKLDSHAVGVWEKEFGYRGYTASSVAITSDGRCVVVGHGYELHNPKSVFSYCAIFFPDGKYDVLLPYGGGDSANAASVAADQDEGILIAGVSREFEYDGDPYGKASSTLQGYAIKCNRDGSMWWGKNFEGLPCAVMADGSGGLIAASDDSRNLAKERPRPLDVFARGYSGEGKLIWVYESDDPEAEELTGAAQGPDGSVYLTGGRGNTEDRRVFIRKLDTSRFQRPK